jgi:pyruvate formate lyase activating enzyme
MNDMSRPEVLHPGRWWHRTDDGRIQCDLCPRDCRLHEGQRGACFVRQRVGDQMVLTTYGRSSGFCIDPIEKKPLNHFHPGSSVLSFGTAGCNLACKFCQNWDISKSRDMDRLMDQASPELIAEAAYRTGSRSVAFTYNDPVIFAEYAMDAADACHALGIFSGSHLQPVLDTLVYLKHDTDVWFEITTLLIPTKNDSVEEVTAMCKWIAKELGTDVPLHFTAFHPDYKMGDIPATPASTLARSRDIAIREGLQYVYTGNVHDTTGGTTFCPGCGEALIVRDWHQILQYRVTRAGTCAGCATPIAGRFSEFNGQHGRRRIPVRLSTFAA